MFEMDWNGLLLPLGFILDGGFLRTLITCLIICPIIPQVLGVVIDGFWMPWSWRYQFLAFIPGNPFLALFIASASTVIDSVHINAVLNVLILVGASVFYLALNRLDITAQYTPGQLRSATKRYHNSLYLWYAYLVGVCVISVMSAPVPVGHKLLIGLPFLGWLACMICDNFFPKNITAQRFRFAHTEPRPIWKNGWRVRRRTPSGYEYEVKA